MASSFNKHRSEFELDGKQYPDKDPDSTKVQSTSGKRIDAHHIELEGQVEGKPDETADYKVSDDGKTLTVISKMVRSSSVFTTVWDKR